MMLLIYAIVLLALLIGSYTDLKTREVPDWLNYSLIGAGLGINALTSITATDWSYILLSAAGLLLCVGIAFLMFYAGQWGGGDSKMLMGIGALLGLNLMLKPPFIAQNMLVSFFVNLALVGFFYALLWSSLLALKNRKRFLRQLKKDTKRVVMARRAMLLAAIIILPALFLTSDFLIRLALIALVVLSFTTFYTWLFIKAVEKSSMYKLVAPEKLTEGDWIAKEVKIGRRYVCGPKDLGIEKKQIQQLIKLKKNGKIEKVLVKEGIPFVPSFLIAFVISLVWGNLAMMFI